MYAIRSYYAYGFTRWQVFKDILFPQMMRFALPGIGNNWMVTLKATALVSIIGLADVRVDDALVARQQSEGVNQLVARLACVIFRPVLFEILDSLDHRQDDLLGQHGLA